MLSHAQIWSGIDELARRYSLTPSGLAKLARLDPTTFNKSKRHSADSGKPRWPSTESIAKVLEATGASFSEFAALASSREERGPSIPLMGLAQAGHDGFFDDAGFPAGAGWDEISFPGAPGDGAYALEISGDSMAPVYRPGDRIIVAPGQEVRQGDRVVVRTTGGEVMAKQLGRVTARRIELISLNPEYDARTIDVSEVDWIARILWASQ
ncbi:MAG: helix-turn-helix transcriptional regulator [Maricaulaceae bacterium]|jgi:phage repressor protein C with HTH and peptisase S24 domain